MTDVTRRDVPAEIALYRGSFASQPLAFAHLMDAAPDLDLGHVEVVAQAVAVKRLKCWFTADQAEKLAAELSPGESMIVVLPAAFPGHTCPLGSTEHLEPLGIRRGSIPHLSIDPG